MLTAVQVRWLDAADCVGPRESMFQHWIRVQGAQGVLGCYSFVLEGEAFSVLCTCCLALLSRGERIGVSVSPPVAGV